MTLKSGLLFTESRIGFIQGDIRKTSSEVHFLKCRTSKPPLMSTADKIKTLQGWDESRVATFFNKPCIMANESHNLVNFANVYSDQMCIRDSDYADTLIYKWMVSML